MLQQQAAAAADIALDPGAVRDTIAAVFTHPGYNQSLRQSVGDRILEWIIRTIAAILDTLRGSADIRWLVIGGAALIVAVVLARAAFLAAASARGRTLRPSGAHGRTIDPWTVAADAAEHGRFTEAAHLLYAALLHSLASRHRVVLHPSRTAGEYQRELSVRAPGAHPAFAAFATAYERAIWGRRSCSAEDYQRLLELATRAASLDTERIAA